MQQVSELASLIFGSSTHKLKCVNGTAKMWISCVKRVYALCHAQFVTKIMQLHLLEEEEDSTNRDRHIPR